MQSLTIAILICLLLSQTAFAQTSDSTTISGNYSIRVDSIAIEGNETTEPYIILQELTFHEGDTLTNEIADFNRDRIYSLGLFTYVDIFPMQYDNHTAALIRVQESWYIYPIPFVELKDKDWDKISYGMDIEIKNFRGRNQRLRTRLAFGFDPAYYLFYSDPLINKKYNLYFNSELSYRNVQNRSKTAERIVGCPFNQKFITAQVGLGRRLNLYQYTGIYAGFAFVETPFYYPGISVSGERIDRFGYLGVNFVHDTRDLAQFPKEGFYGSGTLFTKGLGISGINYQVLNFDLRTYHNIYGELHGKIRFATRNVFGKNIPYYDYSFLGYGERVRGNASRVREGFDSYISSLEFFIPVFEKFDVILDFIPILPRSLLTYRLELYISAFGDAGLTKINMRDISLRNIDSGYGLGVTFLILPYNIVRIEGAFSESGNFEFLVDLGISF